ncbi:MAG: YeeE/YedE family protein [Bacteriovoracaceae bacterium]|nr:YeeE/YedE family protein [Bacteriovoracaceae bacterium]
MNSKIIKINSVSFFAGFIFAIGLAISGMTQPQKVIGFLNFSDWDPSLLFVMVGAICVHMVAYPLVRKRSSPLFDVQWHVPDRKDITSRLILGSALFGLGWGLGGFCPGPGLTTLATGDLRTIIFVGSMIVGMILFKKTEIYLKF